MEVQCITTTYPIINSNILYQIIHQLIHLFNHTPPIFTFLHSSTNDLAIRTDETNINKKASHNFYAFTEQFLEPQLSANEELLVASTS